MSSGNAGNSNSSNVNATIDNSGACVAAVVPTTPTPTPEQPKVESASTTTSQVKAPVGGVKAGAGSTDTTSLFVGLLGASVLAIGAGLRKLHALKQS